MAPSRDRLIELMLEEAHGNPPPDLSARIVAEVNGTAAQTGRAPAMAPVLKPVLKPAFPWHWFAAAAAAAVLLGAGFALVFSGNDVPSDVPSVAGSGSNAQPDPAPQPRPNPQPRPSPQPQPRPEPAPQPTPGPMIPEPQPQPQPQPAPQPGPEPEPEPEPAPMPPEEVEKPAPEPEVPAPVPAPKSEEPRPAPGPTVEEPPVQPQPQQPDRPPTEAPRAGPVKTATVLFQSSGAKLSYKEGAATRFTEIKGELELMSGWVLSARHPVLLDLGHGRRAWFEGELGIDIVDGNTTLEVIKEGVYVDALGGKGTVIVRREGTAIEVADAAVLAERMSTIKDGLEVSCLDGEVAWGESRLGAGQGATISGKGFKRTKAEGAKLRDKGLIKDWAKSQNLWREDFDARMGERLFAGEVENGIAIGPGGREVSIGCYLRESREASERTFLRVRIRVTANTGLYLQLIGDEGKSRFGKEFLVPAGQWVTLKIPVLACREGDNGMRAPAKPGEKEGNKGGEKNEKIDAASLLQKFHVATKNKNTQIEIDWIEIGDEPAQK